MQFTIKWLPRILAIAFALFLSLFALDSFGEDLPLLEQVTGFLIHLAPVYMLVIATVIAWRWPLVGGVLFLAVGVMFTFWFNTYRSAIAFLMVSLPVFIIGVLLLADALFIENRPHSPA